jgi:excinuclease ABC subunit B
MQKAIDETHRRREIQRAYNKKHGITPETIRKEITMILSSIHEADYAAVPAVSEPDVSFGSIDDLEKMIEELQSEMRQAAKSLEYEKAAAFRDQIKDLRALHLDLK